MDFGYFTDMIVVKKIVVMRGNQMVVTDGMHNWNFSFFQFQENRGGNLVVNLMDMSNIRPKYI